LQAGLFSLSWDNIDPMITECQKLAINALGYNIHQHRIHGMGHGEWMESVMTQLTEVDVFLFIDADAVPLHKGAIEHALNAASQGRVFGCAQSANHIEARRDHLYAGPFFLAVSRATWQRLGSPSLRHGSDRDVGQGLTLAAEAQRCEVELWFPTSVEIKKWPLGNTGAHFGIGTVYNNGVYHLFESRSGQHQERFAAVCERVQQQAIAKSTAPSKVTATQPTPGFTSDWFSRHIPVWQRLLSHLEGAPAQVLEIGSYEGRSTVWLCDNILTHPDTGITCIDLFDGDGTDRYQAPDQIALKQRFEANTREHRQKITMIHGASGEVLRTFQRTEQFDAIYIDGSHKSWHVLEDAVLSFPLLKKGGIMLFDDYEGGDTSSLEYPHQAIDAFVRIHSNGIDVVHTGYQIALRKRDATTC
jgi:predicted O-methyltransferase YrrM